MIPYKNQENSDQLAHAHTPINTYKDCYNTMQYLNTDSQNS